MKTQVCFVNSDNPAIKENHIAFFVKKDGEEILLYEVRELTYPHPDEPDMAVVKLLDVKLVRSAKFFSQDSADLELFLAAQNNVKK